MIYSVTVTNNLGESLEMILTQPELSGGLIVKSIDGMGPSSANVNITELVTMDGGLVNSTRLDSKEIKIDLIFMEMPTIEDTRLRTYQYFPIKKPISLTFKTIRPGNIVKTATIYGVVEKNEPKIFQKQESASITIKCADPYFHSESLNSKMFFGAEPLFEFEWSNEIDANPEWEYYDIDTYGVDGIIDSDRIVYHEEYRETEEFVSDTGFFDTFDDIDKIGIRIELVMATIYGTTRREDLYNGSVTKILSDPDPSTMIVPPDSHNVLIYGENDASSGITLFVSREGSGDLKFRYMASPTGLWAYFVYFIAYTAHGQSAAKTIYYESSEAETIEDHEIPMNVERTYICKCPALNVKLSIKQDPYPIAIPMYEKTITTIQEDVDPNNIKIQDGTTNYELYNQYAARILISRSGEILTLKLITSSSIRNPTYDIDIDKCQVYKRYKDVFHTELGILNTITEGNIWYDGDGDTGFIVDVIYKGTATGIQFIDKESGERIIVDETKLRAKVGSPQYNDILRVNTIRGQKSAKYIRETTKQEWDILSCLVPPINWLKLTQGKNVFGYAAETGLDKLVFNVTYDVLYGGI